MRVGQSPRGDAEEKSTPSHSSLLFCSRLTCQGRTSGSARKKRAWDAEDSAEGRLVALRGPSARQTHCPRP